MDILEQYKTEHPEAFRAVSIQNTGTGQPALIRIVMQLSGGMVRDVRQANMVLLGIAIIAAVAGIALFFAISLAPKSAEIYSPVAEPFDSQTPLP